LSTKFVRITGGNCDVGDLPPLDGERLVVPVFLGAQYVDLGVYPGLRHDEPGSRGARRREGEEGGRERRYDNGGRSSGLGDACRWAIPRLRVDRAAAIAGAEGPRVSAGRKGRGGDKSSGASCLI
jgi:hypothetical protein